MSDCYICLPLRYNPALQIHTKCALKRDRKSWENSIYICSSVYRNSRLKKSNNMQLYADIYLLLNYSACFRRPSHSSSGVYETVAAASGTDHTMWGASFLKRDQISSYLVTFEEACSPDSMICTRGCSYSFIYSWWWVRWTPETCRVI